MNEQDPPTLRDVLATRGLLRTKNGHVIDAATADTVDCLTGDMKCGKCDGKGSLFNGKGISDMRADRRDGICVRCPECNGTGRAQPDGDRVRRAVLVAVEILGRSERGRKVIRDLEMLLKGPISHLDAAGWDAVNMLMVAYNRGFAGSVLEALDCCSNGGVA